MPTTLNRIRSETSVELIIRRGRGKEPRFGEFRECELAPGWMPGPERDPAAYNYLAQVCNVLAQTVPTQMARTWQR